MNKFILILEAGFDKDMGIEQPNMKCKREELGMEQTGKLKTDCSSNQHFSKCGLQSSSICISWILSEMQILSPSSESEAWVGVRNL